MRFLHPLSAGLLALGVLAGCALEPRELLTAREPLICPRAEVIEQASSYSDFGTGQIGDVNAMRYNVRFAGLSGECALDDDGQLELQVYMLFLAQPGGGLEADTVTAAPWYLSILKKNGDQQAVVARKKLVQEVRLNRDGDVVAIREHFSVSIPNQTDSTVSDFRIIGGFLLNDAEWDFNEANPFYFR